MGNCRVLLKVSIMIMNDYLTFTLDSELGESLNNTI